MVSRIGGMMHVQYWGIGASAMTPLPMSQDEISSRLLEDWVPSLPTTISAAFMGWPSLLIKDIHIGTLDYLTLGTQVGKCERQWKGFLSWMLGVAGARHVLAKEGYEWIAPASAFYPNVGDAIDLHSWHPSFPRSAVTVSLPPIPRSRLRPDYLAIRGTGGAGVEWAVVEAKGTSRCLTSMNSCPRNWYNQARNIQVDVQGTIANVPRHIVIATRTNPNAKQDRTRQLQVRAWNSVEKQVEALLPDEAAVEIVAAHLFGLFQNLRLRENAQALAASVETRAESRLNGALDRTKSTLEHLRELADSELERLTHSQREGSDYWTGGNIEIEMEFGTVSVEISSATLSLSAKLSLSKTKDDAVKALREESGRLKEWDSSQRQKDDAGIVLSSGVRARFRRNNIS